MTNPIKLLADRFQLDGPAIDAEWYTAHGKPCLTKQGIQKIATALRVRFDHADAFQIVPPLVVFTGTASCDVDSTTFTVFEVGSCRFDGDKQTPERTFAPEMAFKRWRGRAVSALACRVLGINGTIYTEDELAHIATTGTPAPAAPSNGGGADRAEWQRPANADAPQDTTRPGQQAGGRGSLDSLPGEFDTLVLKVAEALNAEVDKVHRLVLCHAGKFRDKETGAWIFPDRYSHAFVDVFNAKPKWALRIKKDAEAIESVALEHRSFTFEVPAEGGGLRQFQLSAADAGGYQPAPERAEAHATDDGGFPDDVPF